jgi:four helix bundle protein
MTPDELSERLLDFAVRIGNVVNALPDTRLGRHIAGQLIRCGTSGGPNYEEGCAGASRDDFIHKLSVALKELRESRYWIRFIIKATLLPKLRLSEMLGECNALYNILGSSVATANRKRKSKNDTDTLQ